MRSARVGLLALCLWLSSFGRAHANDEYAFAVELDVDAGKQPAYFCVITARGSLGYSLELKKLESGALEANPVADGGTRFRAPSETLVSELAGTSGDSKKQPDKTARNAREALRGALESLAIPRSSARCSDAYGECSPRLWSASTRDWFSRYAKRTLTDDLHMTCAANSALHRDKSAHLGDGSVAIVSLDFIQGEDAPISELRLDGSAASIIVRGAIPAKESAALRVVGGDYLTGSSEITVGGRAKLALQPLCATHSVKLPAVNLDASEAMKVSLSHEGDNDPRQCTADVVGSQMSIELPNTSRYHEYTLKAEMSNTILFATWAGSSPPEQVVAHMTTVTFKWDADCTYPLDAGCPQASLDGVDCPSTIDQRSCAYTCKTTGSFELPATIDFVHQLERWSAPLRFPGQTITQYIDPAARKIALAFPGWGRIPMKEGLNIQGVELEVADGKTLYVDTRDRMLNSTNIGGEKIEVRVPYLRCNETHFRLVSSERFTGFEDKLDIENGVADVPFPKCSRDSIYCLSFRLLVTAGVFDRTNTIPGFPQPALGNTTTVSGFFLGDYTSWNSVTYASFGYGATLGAREYIADTGTGFDSRGALYGRVGLDVEAGLRSPDARPFLPALRLGLGLMFGYGHAIDPGYGSAIGGDLYASPAIMIHWGRVLLAVRWMLWEKLDVISTMTGARTQEHGSIPTGYVLGYVF